MLILGEIEAAKLHPVISSMFKKMHAEQPTGELVVISVNELEMKVLQADFENMRIKNKWRYVDQPQLEKAELMHLVGIALKNSSKSNCTWFKDKAMRIHSDPEEFDRNSFKTLVRLNKMAYLLICYWGVAVGGKDVTILDGEGTYDPMVDTGE